MYVYVVFPIANYQQFIYSVPSDLTPNIKEGVCVYASFRNKMEYGFITIIFGGIAIGSVTGIFYNGLVALLLLRLVLGISYPLLAKISLPFRKKTTSFQ